MIDFCLFSKSSVSSYKFLGMLQLKYLHKGNACLIIQANTRRRLDVVSTLLTFKQRCINVKTKSCAYWEGHLCGSRCGVSRNGLYGI